MAVDVLAPAQLPDVSQAQSPGVAYALIAGSILIAFVPVVMALLKDRKPDDTTTEPPRLAAAVSQGTDLAERYFTSLEARAERAEQLLTETRDEMAAAERRHATERLDWQRKLDAAHAEIEQLRDQIERLTWRLGGTR